MVALRFKKMGGRVARLAILILLLLTAASMALEQNLSAVILDLAQADAYSLAVNALNNAVADTMATGVTYEELMTLQRDETGRVSLVQANTMRMNQLATAIALDAQKRLAQGDDQQVHVPLGAAFGIPLLAGLGPELAVQIVPVGAVSSQFATEFESAGINQTRHKISLLIRARVALVIPSGAREVSVETQVSVAETIIVGMVPDSFVDVNNTDDLLNLLP